MTEYDMQRLRTALRMYVVEYSLSEDGTLIRTLENAVTDNIDNVRKNIPKDYLPVWIGTSRAEAEAFQLRFNTMLAASDRTEIRWQRLADVLRASLDEIVNELPNKTRKNWIN